MCTWNLQTCVDAITLRSRYQGQTTILKDDRNRICLSLNNSKFLQNAVFTNQNI